MINQNAIKIIAFNRAKARTETVSVEPAETLELEDAVLALEVVLDVEGAVFELEEAVLELEETLLELEETLEPEPLELLLLHMDVVGGV